MTETLCFLR